MVQNKEKRKEYNRKYYQKNKEKRKEYDRKKYITPQGKKTNKIASWKKQGLILPDNYYSILYDYFINTNQCEVCNKTFRNRRDRCLDHCHETGAFRWVLCTSCNARDSWKKKITIETPVVLSYPNL